MMQGIVYFHG